MPSRNHHPGALDRVAAEKASIMSTSRAFTASPPPCTDFGANKVWRTMIGESPRAENAFLRRSIDEQAHMGMTLIGTQHAEQLTQRAGRAFDILSEVVLGKHEGASDLTRSIVISRNLDD